MISLSRICFSMPLALMALALAMPLTAATVTGRVQLADAAEHAGNRQADYSSVVVWLRPVGINLPLAPPRRARMLQKNKTFSPHVLAVEVGSTVDFPNLDPIFHNAFSNFDGELFDVSLYPPGSSRSVKFGRAGVVRVFCNIHPSMSATIVVLDSAFFAITDKQGHFSILNVPAGPYTLHVFHERALPSTLDSLTSAVTVTGTSLALPLLTISEAGYLPMPHKNKYGRDYPAAASDTAGYPATPK